MRKPEYISPSALAVYEQSDEAYYMQYLSDIRPPRAPQNAAMAAGSAFDAYVKSHLHSVVYGPQAKDSNKYQLKALFESQVEPQCRDQCWSVGQYLFDCYKQSGALADLMLELSSAVDEPRFEFDLKGEVKGSREGVSANTQGVILMGKPDLRVINSEGAHVIYDWKVNGYFSRTPPSPKPGYVQIREDNGHFWNRLGCHKDAILTKHKGIEINIASYLEDVEVSWATQLSTYGWLLGEPVGAEIIMGVEQLCCNTVKSNLLGRPAVRIASHRTRVKQAFQYMILERYRHLWGLIHSNPFYFFTNLSLEESQAKCRLLDGVSKDMKNSEGDSMLSFIHNGAR